MHTISTNMSFNEAVSIDNRFFQGSSCGRPRVHHRRRLGQQPDTDLQPGQQLPEGVRVLGVGRRGVQGSGGSGSHVQREHTSVRPGEPQTSSVLK